MNVTVDEDDDGWVFYSGATKFHEDLHKIRQLTGSACYEIKGDANNWYVRRVED